jgi:large subunit ribosomal protein L5
MAKKKGGEAPVITATPKGYIPTLKKQYKEAIIPALMKEFGYKSIMQVPRLDKIVINQGLGSAASGDDKKKIVEVAQEELSVIAGQKAIITRSKKDISNFKLRKGMAIGVKVTLRGARMYEFCERLISIALPRIRDFKGITDKFDGRGNYTLGIEEQIIFPEIDIDKVSKIMGMEISFICSSDSDKESYSLLRHFGLPFKNAKKND